MNKVYDTDVAIIGSGMGSLSAAALLTRAGLRCAVVEANHAPGGCTSSYWRKGYVFEAGATTLVGLGEGMPLQYVLDRTGIAIKARRLGVPMAVHLPDGRTATRWENIDRWAEEAQTIFGTGDHRGLWKKLYELSRFVWRVSTRQTTFPPATAGDLIEMAKNASVGDVASLRHLLGTTADMVRRYGAETELFRRFVDEQLIISAQNNADEVRPLFGAAALCYTNIPNYYVDGGLINLVQPFCDWLLRGGSQVFLRTEATAIEQEAEQRWLVKTNKLTLRARAVVSGVPIENTLALAGLEDKHRRKMLEPDKLNGAFTMGIAFRSDDAPEILHHQIHLTTPLPHGSNSIFLSLCPADDRERAPEGFLVGAVSTHIPHPEKNFAIDKKEYTDRIFDALEERGLVRRSSVEYWHAANPRTWQKWTLRKGGFVGGYPQFASVAPWQMNESRLEPGLYICGDTTYPGQGIPGVTLSGIIAARKLLRDMYEKDILPPGEIA